MRKMEKISFIEKYAINFFKGMKVQTKNQQYGPRNFILRADAYLSGLYNRCFFDGYNL